MDLSPFENVKTREPRFVMDNKEMVIWYEKVDGVDAINLLKSLSNSMGTASFYQKMET